jgi:DNA invertase Pin-like site-specific DNA recombinase
VTPAAVRCAIYTRKSSEEGLEQSFNSLDAQREACEAYIKSQKHEGWTVVARKYDDGGFSGGNMARPALKRLMEDVEAGRVDTIVVYKVDRLTRSLADFAKIVEKLDEQKVSLVSVTQQFNTTTSMGRLTLNVLLSFAQFEREVTGERIRDKIAASKRKGMWMGGVVPLGYELQDRKLIPNREDAALVQKIFEAYLEQGCVSELQVHLNRIGIVSKRRVSKSGNATGGKVFSRGALYALLQNRIYLGEITHKDASYPGQHKAIISQELWDKAHAQLKGNLQSDQRRATSSQTRPLTSKLFDAAGAQFTPTHSLKGGRRYHYYVSKITAKSRTQSAAGRIRIPADRLDYAVEEAVRGFLKSPHKLIEALQSAPESSLLPELLKALRERPPVDVATMHKLVEKVIIHADQLEVQVSWRTLQRHLGVGTIADAPPEPHVSLNVSTRLKQQGTEIRVVLPPTNAHGRGETDGALVRAVARAHDWLGLIISGRIPNARALAKSSGFDERYIGRILPLAFLAPDMTERILDSSSSETIALSECPGDLPLDWQQQRAMLSFYER